MGLDEMGWDGMGWDGMEMVASYVLCTGMELGGLGWDGWGRITEG